MSTIWVKKSDDPDLLQRDRIFREIGRIEDTDNQHIHIEIRELTENKSSDRPTNMCGNILLYNIYNHIEFI